MYPWLRPLKLENSDLLWTVVIKQLLTSHQDHKLEVEFGYTTSHTPISNVELKLQVYFFPRSLSRLFSNVFDGLFPLKDGTNKQVQPPRGCSQNSSENIRTLIMLMPYEMIQLSRKMEIKVCLENQISSVEAKSNRCFHRKPHIIPWSLRSFWVERFDLNQSLKVDVSRK